MKFNRAMNRLESYKKVKRSIWPENTFLYIDPKDIKILYGRDQIPETILDSVNLWCDEASLYRDIQLVIPSGSNVMIFQKWSPSSEDLLATDWEIYQKTELE